MKKPAFLCLSLYTYLDLLEHGDSIIGFIEQSLELVRVLSSDLRVQPRFLHGASGSIEPLANASEKVWAQVRDGRLEGLTIAQQDWKCRSGAPAVVLELQFASFRFYPHYQQLRYLSLPKEVNDPTAPKGLLLTVNKELISDEMHEVLFESLVDLGVWSVAALGAVYGFVSFGGFGPFVRGDTPYEQTHHLTLSAFEGDLRRKTRGIFHGNLLTKGHVEALGGLDSVRWPAAVSHAAARRVQGREVLDLRVGKSDLPLSRDATRQMELQLASILPQPRDLVLVHMLNAGVDPGLTDTTRRVEDIVPPTQMVQLPSGATLAFLSEKLLGTDRVASKIAQSVLVTEQSGGFWWAEPVHGALWPGWHLFRIGKPGSSTNRMPYIACVGGHAL